MQWPSDHSGNVHDHSVPAPRLRCVWELHFAVNCDALISMPTSQREEVTLTPQQLVATCKATSGYSTPHLNDKLYLHYKKLTHLRNLEPYTGVVVLYAEGNQLQECSGLEGPSQTLKCLYLQQNSISDLSGLAICTQLTTLNLASNMLTSLTSAVPWSNMQSLHTLNLASNQLKSVAELQGLLQCRQSLSCLDLSYNQLSATSDTDVQQLYDFLTAFPSLKILYLHHNPLCQTLPAYRKTLTAKLLHLTYLDERPVTDNDHRLAVAYVSGGMESEQRERRVIAEEVRQSESQRMRNVCELVAEPIANDDDKIHVDETVNEDKITVIDSSDSETDTDDVETIQQFANQQRADEDDIHIQRVRQKWETRLAGGSTDQAADDEQITVVEEVVNTDNQPPIRSQATAVVSVDTMD